MCVCVCVYVCMFVCCLYTVDTSSDNGSFFFVVLFFECSWNWFHDCCCFLLLNSFALISENLRDEEFEADLNNDNDDRLIYCDAVVHLFKYFPSPVFVFIGLFVRFIKCLSNYKLSPIECSCRASRMVAMIYFLLACNISMRSVWVGALPAQCFK